MIVRSERLQVTSLEQQWRAHQETRNGGRKRHCFDNRSAMAGLAGRRQGRRRLLLSPRLGRLTVVFSRQRRWRRIRLRKEGGQARGRFWRWRGAAPARQRIDCLRVAQLRYKRLGLGIRGPCFGFGSIQTPLQSRFLLDGFVPCCLDLGNGGFQIDNHAACCLDLTRRALLLAFQLLDAPRHLIAVAIRFGFTLSQGLDLRFDGSKLMHRIIALVAKLLLRLRLFDDLIAQRAIATLGAFAARALRDQLGLHPVDQPSDPQRCELEFHLLLERRPALLLLAARPIGQIGALSGIQTHRELLHSQGIEQHRNKLTLLFGDGRFVSDVVRRDRIL
jgi:hypothetical protein